MNIDALSGIEEAYDDAEAFRAFCCRFRHEHPEIMPPLFKQCFLEPVETLDVTPQNCRHLLTYDEFSENLSTDWTWNDPFDDCSFALSKGLDMRAANGRDLWYLNLSAPRILRSVSGDFSAQTICIPVSEEKPCIGGILLWKDDKNFLRLDRGTRGRYEVSFTGCIRNRDVIIGRGKLHSESMFLRLERLDYRVDTLCSADGVNWFTVGNVEFPIEDPVEIGLHAVGAIDRNIYHGAYPGGSAIHFESFQLWVEADPEDGAMN